MHWCINEQYCKTLITLRIGEGLSVKLQLSYRQQFQLAFSYIMLNIWTPLSKYFLLIEYQLNQYLQMWKLTLYSQVVCIPIKKSFHNSSGIPVEFHWSHGKKLENDWNQWNLWNSSESPLEFQQFITLTPVKFHL